MGCVHHSQKKEGGVVKGFECRCPFHRLNAKSDCKKSLPFDTNEVDEEVALLAAYWWCNQALYHARQRLHLDCLRHVMEIPVFPLALLVAEQIQGPAPLKENVKTDQELDAEEKAARAGCAAAPMGRGHVAGRRGGRGRGRARGRARGQAQQQDSSEMGSASGSQSPKHAEEDSSEMGAASESD